MASRRLCAAALLVTAVIHVAVVPEHLREWPAAAAFFVVLAGVEAVLAVAVLTRTDRSLLVASAAISVLSALLWAASRTVGLPIGPEAFRPEAVAVPDLAATALEVFAAAVLARMAFRTTAAGVTAPAHQQRRSTMSVNGTRVRRRRLALIGAIVAGSVSAAACGSSPGGSSGAKDTPTSTSAAGTSVAIDTFMFSPKALPVKVGDTVTWTNHDNIVHTVTSGTREYEPGDSGHVTATHKDGMFDMQLDGKGATAKHTFTNAGTFHYFCDRHPGMEADIEVS